MCHHVPPCFAQPCVLSLCPCCGGHTPCAALCRALLPRSLAPVEGSLGLRLTWCSASTSLVRGYSASTSLIKSVVPGAQPPQARSGAALDLVLSHHKLRQVTCSYADCATDWLHDHASPTSGSISTPVGVIVAESSQATACALACPCCLLAAGARHAQPRDGLGAGLPQALPCRH